MTTELVGRAEELEALGAALDDALGGLGRLVLLRGDAGIGKTRLAREIAQRGEAAGAVALVGRAWEEGGAPTAWPFVEVLRAARASASLAAAHPALDAALDALRSPGDADAARFAALDAVARALEAAAREAPLVVVLDDLHWADPATLQLARLVVRALARCRALVIGTYRGLEARGSPEALRLLGELEREGRVLAPRPLEASDVAILVARAGVASAWAARVHDKTGGNPFYVEETVRWIASEGRDPEAELPYADAARAIVARRLDRLPDATRRLVEVAAAIGSEMDRALLVAAAGAQEPDLRRAIEHGALALAGDRVAFTHDLVRETVLATARDLASAHAAIAAQIERRGGDPVELARHRAACGDPRAVDAAVEAARSASRRGQHGEAAELLGLALASLRARDAAPDRAEVELAIEHGEASIRAGHVTAGAARCAEAARLARRLEDPELVARAALAYGAVTRFGRVDPQLVELLEEALAARPGPALRATLEARLAAASQPSPTPEVPLARARRAIADARRQGDAALLARVLDLARPAFRALDDVDERIAIDEETLALADAAGDLERAVRAERRLAFDRLERGDVAAFDRHLVRVAARDPEARWTSAAFVDLSAGVTRALLTGDFDRAERALRRGAELLRAIPDAAELVGPSPLPMMRVLLLRARRRTEDLPALAAIDVPLFPLRELLVTVVRAQAGDLAGAAAALEGIFERGEHVRLNYLPRALLPEVIATLGDARRAETMLPLVEALSGRNVVGAAGLCEGAADRLVGLLHATMGRRDDALACLERALAMNEAMGAAPFVHATKLAIAELRPEDPRAGALLAEAIEGFGALGMTASLARAVALAGGASPRAEAPIEAPRATLATLRREGEVWTLTHAGQAHRLKDAHGLAYLAHLLARPGTEVHVADLFALIPRGGDDVERGDAGEVLDARAKAAYRSRLADLRDRLAEAEQFNDLGRAAAAREEMELLSRELARAVGLGGRDRRAASRAERTRVNVTLRIRKAIDKIAALCPPVGDHLERSVVTGAFCRYDPPPGARVTT